MREPLRCRDDGSVPSDVRDLLDRARRSQRLPPRVRTRSAERLDRLLVLPAASGALLWLKGVALAAGLGVVTVATVVPIVSRARHAPPSAEAPVTTVQLPAARQKPALPADTSPQPLASDVAPAVSVSAPVSASVASTAALARSAVPSQAPPLQPAPTPPVDGLSQEAALLEKARASLDSDPTAALAELDAHAAAFPNGMLRTERDLLAVDALSRLGRATDARTRGERLLREEHGSLYAERVRAILGRLPSP